MYQEVASHSPNLSGRECDVILETSLTLLHSPENYSTDWHWIVAFCVETVPSHTFKLWAIQSFCKVVLESDLAFETQKSNKNDNTFFSTVPHLHCCFRVCRDKVYRLVPSRKLTWKSQYASLFDDFLYSISGSMLVFGGVAKVNHAWISLNLSR